MNSLLYLLLVISLSVVLIVFATNRWKMHPFFALLVSAIFVGLATGMEPLTVVESISTGFGNMLSNIGLIVVLGTVIGLFTEKSGALDAIAGGILKSFGKKNATSSMAFLGAIVSIPVFCDSGFIILSKMARRIASSGKMNPAVLSLALAGGLYTTHTLIPPTPGPVAVAGNLGAVDQLGLIILVGLFISVPVLVLNVYFAKRLGSSIAITHDEEGEIEGFSMNIFWAWTPIVLPVLLIAVASLIKLIQLEGLAIPVLEFLGNPIIALLIGCVLSMIQFILGPGAGNQNDLFKTGVEQAGPIVLITGAGGAFGNVLKHTALADHLGFFFDGSITAFPILLLVAFLLAAILKTAQGSSTSALVISSALLAPLVLGMEGVTSFQVALMVMAFGGGAMTVSHANDSYFWVVTQFSGFDVKQGYKGFTSLTLIQGLTTAASVLVLYWLSLLF